jgi:serine/threonine-protein kinase
MPSSSRLQELVAQWSALQEQGKEATPEELCRDTPELIDQLKQELRSRRRSDSGEATQADDTNSYPAALAPTPPWPAIPGYAILERLGKGGVGIVYKAIDLDLDRVVALKTLQAGICAEQPARERFQREARAMAQLDHAHIVPIYGEGSFEGQPFFTMKFMPGGSLAQRLDLYRQSPRAAVVLMHKIARAVQYLHDKKILHRDLKPFNILLGEGDEPYVSDFGLAKFLDADLELTQTGEVMGTLPYMAPEQATGQVAQFGPATDVWALGVMLYQLLSGCRPFEGAVRAEIFQKILTVDPDPPKSPGGVDGGLQAVVLKCLAKCPSQRFATAAELADELQRWLNDEPPLTRPPAWPRRLWRHIRRHPLKAASLALVVLAVAAGLGLAWLLNPHRQRVVFQQELAAGKNMSALDSAGNLRWPRWRAGATSIIEHEAGSGAFGFQSHQLSLLEIFPEVEQASYHIRALTRHEDSDGGQIGLCFGMTEVPTDSGPVLFFCSFTFNDVEVIDPQQINGGNPAALTMNVYREEDRKRAIPSLPHGRLGGGPPVFFVPTLKRGARNPWRPLVVDITPESIQTVWNDETGIQTRILTRADYLLKVRSGAKKIQPAQGHTWEFPPPGGIGLLVVRGEASFKDIEIRRLPIQP